MEERDFSERPEKPDASDCCNSGCDPCVLDLYEKRIKEWENRYSHNVISTRSEVRTDLLSETKLKQFCLVNKIQLFENVYRFTFQPVLSNNDETKNFNDLVPIDQILEKNISGILPYKVGQHIILRGYDITDLKNELSKGVNKNNNVIEPETIINYLSRAYTPVTIASEQSNCCFEIVVKIYNYGEMSKYLNKLQLGDIVACRGPYGNFVYSANMYRHLLMLCIGTGIAPMYSIIKSIINNDKDETFVQLMYGVQTANDIILRDELRQFTAYWNFNEQFYLSQSNLETPKFGENFIYNRIDSKAIINYVIDKNKSELLVLICGTDSFCQNIEKCVSDFGIDKTNIHVF